MTTAATAASVNQAFLYPSNKVLIEFIWTHFLYCFTTKGQASADTDKIHDTERDQTRYQHVSTNKIKKTISQMSPPLNNLNSLKYIFPESLS